MNKTRTLATLVVLLGLITTIGFNMNLNKDLTYSTQITLLDAFERNEINQEVQNQSQVPLVALEEFVESTDQNQAQDDAQNEAQGEVTETIATDQPDSAPQKELVGEFKLTFYTASSDETDNTPNITASGTRVKPGVTVAVDPRYWKMGTKFYVEGYGYVVAEDTGSHIKGPHAMDVSVATKDQAFKNGIQYRKVYVVNA